jgi:hypothetical protein
VWTEGRKEEMAEKQKREGNNRKRKKVGKGVSK